MASAPLPQPTPLPWYRPPAASGRSLAPDLARGFMLLLIAFANSTWYLWGGQFGDFSLHPTDGTALDRALRAVLAVAVDGRIFPMFAFLLGYGMVQFARSRAGRGLHPLEIRRQLRRRHLFLLLFGFVHATLLFAGEILGSYGLVGLVLVALFFNRSDKVVFTWFVVLAVLIVGAGVAVTLLPWALAAAVAADPVLADEMAGMDFRGGFSFEPAAQANYLVSLLERLGLWLLTTPAVLLMLSIPAAILLGWLAARRGILEHPQQHRRMLTWVAVVGITIGWLSGVPLALYQLGVLDLPEYLSWAPLPVAYVFGPFAGIGYAALFGVIAARVRTPGRVSLAVAAVGRRSLTFYLWQSIVMAPLLSAWGLGVGRLVNTSGVLAIAAAVWLAGLAIAVWLDATGRPGPFEALLRRLVNRGQPIVPPGWGGPPPVAAAAASGRE